MLSWVEKEKKFYNLGPRVEPHDTLSSPKVLINTQEAVTVSQHDWKIVDLGS